MKCLWRCPLEFEGWKSLLVFTFALVVCRDWKCEEQRGVRVKSGHGETSNQICSRTGINLLCFVSALHSRFQSLDPRTSHLPTNGAMHRNCHSFYFSLHSYICASKPILSFLLLFNQSRIPLKICHEQNQFQDYF